MLLSSGAPVVLPPFSLLGLLARSLFLIVFFSGGINEEGGNEGKESVCGGAVPALQLETLDHPGTTVSLVQISHLFIMKTSSMAFPKPGNVS